MHVWIRGLPTYGFIYLVPMFRRVVIVATGSGIAPCTSHLLAAKIPLRLFWVAPNINKTYGPELVNKILNAEPGAVVYDTRKHGKPDVVRLTYCVVRDFDAKAVFIVSNVALRQKVVYGLMSMGIPTSGAIWDS